MARPCKPVSVMSKNLTKEEKDIRLRNEERLKGKDDKIKPPSYLNRNQKTIFKYIVQEMQESNVLSNLDIYILTSVSIAIERVRTCEETINKALVEGDVSALENSALIRTKENYMKDFFRCCNELGLSPQSRAKFANINLQAAQQEVDPVLELISSE